MVSTLKNNEGTRTGEFAPTRWTLVLSARGKTSEARLALSELCAMYYQPVLRFLQHEGWTEDESKELVQAFFSRLLSGHGIASVDPAKGRFRSYVIGALRHFLSDHRERENALKRGGGVVVGSLDELAMSEGDSGASIAVSGVQDACFDRQWAYAIMERALAALRDEHESAGRGPKFERLKPWLVGPAAAPSDVAVSLGWSEGALKVAVYRVRKRFRELVLADGQRLRQVLENLLGNALKFTRTGSVRMEASRQADGSCRFAVSDTGAGMSTEDCARLFQPFSQAVSGRPPEPGAGLGLAISQHLVGLMGGRIEVSSALGKGSRFEFQLTFEAAGAVTTPASVPGRGWRRYRGARRRVLVVDDLEINRRLLRELLEGMGFEVDEAEGGIRALERMRDGEPRPDLVILDLRMPGMDGFELTRRLRGMPEGNALKIIATSASVFSFTRADALGLGCDDFLPKPFQEEQLMTLLESCLGLEWEKTEKDGDEARISEGVRAQGSGMEKPWDREMLQRLLEAANRGDVAAVRAELTVARVDGLGPRLALEELEALAARFQMALLRERLAKLLAD